MKYALIIVLTALVVGLGVVAYFKGWLPAVSFTKPQAVSVQNTEIATSPTASPVSSVSFTTVKAGGILSMSSYSINVPSDWTYSKAGSSPGQIDKLILTAANGDKITFTQAAMGGGGCVYPGDPPQEMSASFTSYAPITTSTGEKLRVGTTSSGTMSVCEMQSGAWGDLTEFGHIDISVSPNPTIDELNQINSIISTLKKIGSLTSDNQSILDALKSQLTNGTNLTLSVTKVEGDYAKGMASEQSGGGIWFAAKVKGAWKLVWSGNGIIFCSDIAPYPAFPKDLIPECWDTSTNKLVTR